MPYLHMLIYSGEAINSCNKDYHRHVVATFPYLVTEYLECEPGINYDLVQLKVVVTLSTTDGQFEDGTLSTIIRYKTPYLFNYQPPFSFFRLMR